MTQADWDDPEARVLCAELRMAEGTPAYAEREDALFLVLNAGSAEVTVSLPEPPKGKRWSHRISTTAPWVGARPLGAMMEAPGPSVSVCELEARSG